MHFFFFADYFHVSRLSTDACCKLADFAASSSSND